MSTYKDALAYAREVAGRLRVDTWINTLTGLGGSKDRTQYMGVAAFRPLQTAELDALYHGEDLPAIIVERLPTDALSRGFAYAGNEKLDRLAAEWRVRDMILEARIWGRLYGLGGVVIGVTGDDPRTPLRLEAVRRGSLEFLLPVDKHDLTIATRDERPDSPTYGDPLTYRVGSRSTIHASRVVIFGGARTSTRQRHTYGSDLSVLQRPYGVLRDVEQSWRSVMNLLQDMSQAVFAIDGLMSMIANGQKDVVLDRMQVVNMARSVSRAVVIDAQNERFEHVGAQNLATVDPLLVRIFTRLAAAADMPLTLLMGTSPAGMNATGESDLRIWYKKCDGERDLLAPAILYLGAILARDAGLPVPAALEWPSQWDPTETESAGLDKTRAETAGIRITNQITTPDEEARILGGEDLADVLADRIPADPLASDPELVGDDDPDIETPVGSQWIDTADGHRLEVTATGAGRLYFVDLDSDSPARQWSWSRRGFLERSRRAPGPEGPDVSRETPGEVPGV